MKRPEDLSDDALTVAIAIAQVRRETDGRLGIRTELAALESERNRRQCEALWALPVEVPER